MGFGWFWKRSYNASFKANVAHFFFLSAQSYKYMFERAKWLKYGEKVRKKLNASTMYGLVSGTTFYHFSIFISV